MQSSGHLCSCWLKKTACRWGQSSVRATTRANSLSPANVATGSAAVWPAAPRLQLLRMRAGTKSGPMELSSLRFARVSRHCFSDGKAKDPWISGHWWHSVWTCCLSCGSLHFPANVSANRFALALRTQTPPLVLRAGMLLTWASCFMTSFAFFHHSLGDGFSSRIF